VTPPSTRASRPRARAVTIVLWTAQILLALFFVVAATPKLIGTKQAIEQVHLLGFGDWFRYLIGLCELAGAVGLVIPRLSGLAALGLAVVMFIAAIADLLILPNPPMLPITLLAALVVLACARWPETRLLLLRRRH
jgi:putative oxidoreductase